MARTPKAHSDLDDIDPDLPEDFETEEEFADGETSGEDSVALDLDLSPDATPQRLKAGVEVIQKALKTLPNAPGVYRMLGWMARCFMSAKPRALKSVSRIMRAASAIRAASPA